MNDVRGPGLPLLMAVCIALLVGGVFAVTWWRQPSPDSLADRLGPPPRPAPADSAGPTGPRNVPLRLSPAPRFTRDERFEELRQELARTRAQLEELKARYRERHPEEADLDWSGALAAVDTESRNLLTGEQSGTAARPTPETPPNGDPGTTPGEAAAGGATPEDLAVQLRDLRRRLEVAAFLDEQQRTEIEQLQSELNDLGETLVRQSEREQELSRWLEGERLLQTEASRALIRLGTAAVPQLVAALRGEEAALREWAADVLGAMGAAADAAVPDLMEARSDPDPAVRTAVRRALDAIEGAERP